MTFEDMWKSLEEWDTTGKYKKAREMAELNIEQLEFAYNSGFADAKSKYERPQGEWITTKVDTDLDDTVCSICGKSCEDIEGTPHKTNFCPNCGAKMKKGD